MIGLRFLYLIAIVSLFGVCALFYFTKKLWLFLIGIGVMGGAVGLFSIGMKYGCYFFPRKEGLHQYKKLFN